MIKNYINVALITKTFYQKLIIKKTQIKNNLFFILLPYFYKQHTFLVDQQQQSKFHQTKIHFIRHT